MVLEKVPGQKIAFQVISGKNQGMAWILGGMRNGSFVWFHDGSTWFYESFLGVNLKEQKGVFVLSLGNGLFAETTRGFTMFGSDHKIYSLSDFKLFLIFFSFILFYGISGFFKRYQKSSLVKIISDFVYKSKRPKRGGKKRSKEDLWLKIRNLKRKMNFGRNYL